MSKEVKVRRRHGVEFKKEAVRQLVLTSGFGRAADDAHGNGRAIDFAGLTMTEPTGLADPVFQEHIDFFDPNCTKKIKGQGWETVTVSGGDQGDRSRARVHRREGLRRLLPLGIGQASG